MAERFHLCWREFCAYNFFFHLYFICMLRQKLTIFCYVRNNVCLNSSTFKAFYQTQQLVREQLQYFSDVERLKFLKYCVIILVFFLQIKHLK